MFRDGQGREVTLATEIHVAEPAYYDEVHRRLDGHEAVLLEGLCLFADPQPSSRAEAEARVHARLEVPPAAPPEPDAESGLVGGMPWKAKRRDYVWADVDGATVRAWLAEEGLPADEALAALREEHPVVYTTAGTVLEVSAPTRASLLRSDEPGATPFEAVMIDRRNETALAVLDAELAKGRRRVAFHFGSDHGPGLARGLEARGFERVGEPRWIAAFTGQAYVDRGAFPREVARLSEEHSLFVHSGREVAEIRFGYVSDRDWYGPRGRVLILDLADNLRGESGLGVVGDEDRPLRIPFRHGRELFLGWEEGEAGALVVRHDPPPPGVEPYRFAGPVKTAAETGLPAALAWRDQPRELP